LFYLPFYNLEALDCVDQLNFHKRIGIHYSSLIQEQNCPYRIYQPSQGSDYPIPLSDVVGGLKMKAKRKKELGSKVRLLQEQLVA
jgi:hypothetical protein